MSKSFNPALSRELNLQRDRFNVVVHVPFLPSACEKYSTLVAYLEKDACFYRCTLLEGAWKWEKVTYGINRQYILSVSYVMPSKVEPQYQLVDREKTPSPVEGVTYYTKDEDGEFQPATGISAFADGVDYYEVVNVIRLYVFDDIVSCINDIVNGLKRYGVTEFSYLENATMVEAVATINDLIRHVNYTCGVDLSLIPDDYSSEDEQVMMEEIIAYLNPLVEVLNPHAADKAELQDALEKVAAAAEKIAGESNAQEIEALHNRITTLDAAHKRDVDSIRADLDGKASVVDAERIESELDSAKAAIDELRAAAGSNASALENKASKEEVAAISNSVQTIDGRLATVENVQSQLKTTVQSNVANITTALEKANEANTTAEANESAIAKLNAFATALSKVAASDNMSLTDCADAVRAIVAAAVAAITPDEPVNG
jgi:predicted  nucleic acid-binding Zn-ribbon protein